MMQGATAEIENHFLFVGEGAVEVDKRTLLMVDNTTDIDDALKDAGESLLATVKAAQLNGKQGWTAGVMVIDQEDNWQDAVIKANETSSFEAFVIDMPADEEMLEEAGLLREEIKAKLGRESWALMTVPCIEAEQSWPEWLAETVKIQNSIASPYVSVTPKVHKDGSTLGKIAGRYCNKEVSIADTPARVKTGALIGSNELMTDKGGNTIDLATLKELEKNRLSVPMWYPDIDGMYWTTGRTLDVEGGDYQNVRHLRVVLKAARKLRVRAIMRLGDREFNSTPGSTAAAKQYFMQDLRVMSTVVKIGDYQFPGEIMPPEDEDLTITWQDDENVTLILAVQPYDCPIKITVNIGLKRGTK